MYVFIYIYVCVYVFVDVCNVCKERNVMYVRSAAILILLYVCPHTTLLLYLLQEATASVRRRRIAKKGANCVPHTPHRYEDTHIVV